MTRTFDGWIITEQQYRQLPLPPGGTIQTIGSCFIPATQENVFNSQDLNQKLVAAGIWCYSNGSILYEIARVDGLLIDIDRFSISALSGGTAKVDGPIKSFPEHHSPQLPSYYCGSTINRFATVTLA